MALSRYHPSWPRLIEGNMPYEFEAISASMMMSRIIRSYKSDPTPERMDQLIDEAYDFFKRYEHLFMNDLNKIFD